MPVGNKKYEVKIIFKCLVHAINEEEAQNVAYDWLPNLEPLFIIEEVKK